jgi:hypothetical protein
MDVKCSSSHTCSSKMVRLSDCTCQSATYFIARFASNQRYHRHCEQDLYDRSNMEQDRNIPLRFIMSEHDTETFRLSIANKTLSLRAQICDQSTPVLSNLFLDETCSHTLCCHQPAPCTCKAHGGHLDVTQDMQHHRDLPCSILLSKQGASGGEHRSLVV